MIAYEKKLLDVRWQKKRLDVFNRDKFACKCCGNNQGSMHIHHLEYLGNTEPWDYPLDMLICLCSNCHQKETGRGKIEKTLLLTFKMRGFIYDDLLALSSAIDTNKDFRDYILSYLRKFKNG